MEGTIGQAVYALAFQLFPICRSITGNGVRRTLETFKRIVPELEIAEVESGTKVFDWTVPKEWNIKDAYVVCPDGRKICEFRKNNLNVVGYSTPVDKKVGLDELQQHLYSLPAQPRAIPYVTSYYEERYGFCLPHEEREQLAEGEYRVFIDSTLEDGHLTYGEIIIPGETEEEIFFSTYVCHPSMANNELSGPCTAIFLAEWIKRVPRRYTYRIAFVPETIGAVAYLSRNLDVMKKNVVAGFNLSCLGDSGHFSYIKSRYGDTLADRALKSILRYRDPKHRELSFLMRGSDERQYCAPGVDLPLCCVCRTPFGWYREYHTSDDDMDFIAPEALQESFEMLCSLIEALEANRKYRVTVKCEPHLSPRGLYPSVSEKNLNLNVRHMMNFMAYCDGRNDIFGISDITGAPVGALIPFAKKLEDAGLII